MSAEKFLVHALHAGHGDCLWVEYGDPKRPARILIDGGTVATFGRLSPLLRQLSITGPSHELLVVTHIDSDHIAGVLPVMEGIDSKCFNDIWFNGRAHLQSAGKLEEYGAAQGEKLTSAILRSRARWNGAFQSGPAALNATGLPVALSLAGGATITILSPELLQLEKLLEHWDKEIIKAGLAPNTKAESPIVPPEGLEMLGSLDVDLLADEAFEEDDSPANGSSIAFIAEFAGKRVLFGADAYPSVLLRSVRILQSKGSLELDLFKLPHHGSRNNVSVELIKAIPARQYLFSSNGAYFGHPDPVAVARVIKYGPPGLTLLFNCRTEKNSIWDNAALKRRWGYETRYGERENGIRVELL